MRTSHAFTLIELLTVLGLIGLMTGVMGLAWRDGSPGIALESAQGTVVSLLAAARGQAVLHQNRAMLVVDADPAQELFLRGIHIAIETAPGSGRWWITGDGTVLPRGIYFVPGSGGVSGATLEAAPSGWPDTRRSSTELLPGESIAPAPENPGGKYLGLVTPLTASGLPGAGGGDKLVLAIARRTTTGVIFAHPEQVRGVAVSAYGVAILINEGIGFDF